MTTKNIAPKNVADTLTIQQRQASKLVWVTFDKVGFHRYPDAPDEVAYLRDRHRHVFQFRVAISVHHDDREIEFHMMKNWLMSLYDTGALEVDHKSCEMLGDDLLEKILQKYDCSRRRVVIDVSEDGECGATVFSEPDRLIPLSKEWLKDTYINMATTDDKLVPVPAAKAASRSAKKGSGS